LQYAQHFGLRRQRHIANFIQKDRTAIGLLKFPAAPADSASKGALLMSKEFLSISVSVIAAQFTSTNGLPARLLE
jgi:hypothetical protein